MLTREDCQFQAFFCEENIWQLAKQINDPVNTKVIFISNPYKQVLMLFQEGGTFEPEMFNGAPYVIWDYHVTLIHNKDRKWLCYDLNTSLDFPIAFNDYLKYSFYLDLELDFDGEFDYWPQFRIVDTAYYLSHFSSDRSHMKTAQGDWLKPPPPWEMIHSRKLHNLNEFIDFNNPKHGSIYNLQQIIAQYV